MQTTAGVWGGARSFAAGLPFGAVSMAMSAPSSIWMRVQEQEHRREQRNRARTAFTSGSLSYPMPLMYPPVISSRHGPRVSHETLGSLPCRRRRLPARSQPARPGRDIHRRLARSRTHGSESTTRRHGADAESPSRSRKTVPSFGARNLLPTCRAIPALLVSSLRPGALFRQGCRLWSLLLPFAEVIRHCVQHDQTYCETVRSRAASTCLTRATPLCLSWTKEKARSRSALRSWPLMPRILRMASATLSALPDW